MARKGTLRVRVLGDTKPLVSKLNGLTGKLAGFAKLAGTAVAAGAAAGIAGSIKSFADFDAAMTQSTAIMGDVSAAMRGDMSDAARDVAKTTKFSATEAAESYFFLASAGLDAQQSIDALPQVAKFAQAGMFDMARATDLATDAQSALGLAADDPAKNLENLTRVTDVFVKANTLANTSVEEISEALTNKAGAAMRSVGMDVEEGAAVLAAFADQGVKGAEAGTQFSIVMRDLQTKALANEEAFEKAGVAVFDASGEFNSMGDIIAQLEDRLDGMSDAEKRAELAALGFTDKSIASMMALLGTSDAIKQYEEDLRGAAGTTEEVAGKQMETFWAQLGLLKDQFIDVALQVGEKLMPSLETFVGWLSDHSDDIAGWILGGIDAFGEFAVAVRDWWVESVKPKLESFVGWFADNWPTVEARWDDLRGWVDTAATALTEFWEDHAQPAIDSLVQAVADNWPKLEEAWGILGEIVENVGELISDVASTFGAKTSDMADATTDSQGTISEALGIMIDDLNELLRTVERVTAFIKGSFSTMEAGVSLDILGMIASLDEWSGGALDRFVERTRQGVEDVIAWFRGLPSRVRFALAGFVEDMRQIGRDAAAGMVRGFSLGGVVSGIGDIASAGVRRAKDILGISSPSKVFMQIGDQSAEGYRIGFEDNLPDMSMLAPPGHTGGGVTGRQSMMDAESELAMERAFGRALRDTTFTLQIDPTGVATLVTRGNALQGAT